MFVSHCHVFMSIKENPEAEAHVRLHTLLHVVACCCVLFGIVAQSLNPVKRLSQQLPNFFLFPDRRSLAQQCCRLHCSFNTLGATHAHYTWSPKHYGLYPPHDALHVPTLLGVVAPFAHHCQHGRNNSQHGWPNNIGSCCVCLHVAFHRICVPLHCSWSDKARMSPRRILNVDLSYLPKSYRIFFTDFRT